MTRDNCGCVWLSSARHSFLYEQSLVHFVALTWRMVPCGNLHGWRAVIWFGLWLCALQPYRCHFSVWFACLVGKLVCCGWKSEKVFLHGSIFVFWRSFHWISVIDVQQFYSFSHEISQFYSESTSNARDLDVDFRPMMPHTGRYIAVCRRLIELSINNVIFIYFFILHSYSYVVSDKIFLFFLWN